MGKIVLYLHFVNKNEIYLVCLKGGVVYNSILPLINTLDMSAEALVIESKLSTLYLLSKNQSSVKLSDSKL